MFDTLQQTLSPEIIFVVDDDEAIRDSLQWLLSTNGHHPECFSSAETFLHYLKTRRLPSISCLLLDVRMPGMSGLELQEYLVNSDKYCNLLTAFITGHGDIPMAVSTMKKGAIDFIEKPFDNERLRSLVKTMLNIARNREGQTQKQKATQALLAQLTKREHQVLERITSGRLNKQIAQDLDISIKTVEAHRANLMEKLDANGVADLVRLALTGNIEFDLNG